MKNRTKLFHCCWVAVFGLLLSSFSLSAQERITHLTKDSFLTKVSDYQQEGWSYLGDKPAIVDFYASWCVPCRRLAPVLEELAQEYEGKLVIYKVDTDKARDLATDFGITSIPTLLFVPMQGDPQVVQGALPKEQLIQIIEEILIKE